MNFLIDLSQVILVDLVLAGDNAIIIALAVAGLPKEERKRVMVYGIILATVLRIIFAILTVYLLQIPGLILFGGLLLLWVCFNLGKEILHHASLEDTKDKETNKEPKTKAQAVFQIILADVSMSLDNVLAVAGIARESILVLTVGLILSIAFMGLAAPGIAKLLERHIWIAWLGLLVILYVAVIMIWDGWLQLFA